MACHWPPTGWKVTCVPTENGSSCGWPWARSAAQAAKPAIQAAVKAGLTPAINSMMIAGLVAVPGMMAGQVLVGADVSTALRYQILVYLAISGTSGLSTLILLRIRLRRYFTPADQLRADWLEDFPAKT